MLTRLRIQGFKNLVDTEVRFGPFTCIAGANGVGKSNLFDVIAFLSDLTNHTIEEAASKVRSHEGGTSASLSSLFARQTSEKWRDIRLEADFLVANKVLDDFGREAVPSTTYLTYTVVFRYVPSKDGMRGNERIELLEEVLTYILKSDFKKKIGFPVKKAFVESVSGGTKRTEFISTEQKDGRTTILLRQDKVQGSPSRIPASTSPRTVLSRVNTDDRPTALAAKREMQSWAQLQLEPSKLRASDSFNADDKIAPNGAHLPATLLRIGNFEKVSNLLAGLLPDVDSLRVDIDEVRRSKTLYLKQKGGAEYDARSLSDGTLRFLALAILSCDPLAGGVVCMEEPENGIHPARIPAIVELLKGMCVDPNDGVSEDNPLRQIIINTHSPVVIQQLNTEDLVIASPSKQRRTTVTSFTSIAGTWRSRIDHAGQIASPVTSATLIDYLENATPSELASAPSIADEKTHKKIIHESSGSQSIVAWAQEPFNF